MLSIIVAVDKNNAIGNENKLLFKLPKDLKRFKEITTGHTIIMGRKTYESLPNILPHRHHIIITRNKSFKVEDDRVTVVHSIEEILPYIKDQEEYFVVGGEEIYRQFLPFVEKLYLTVVDQKFKSDASFPEIDPMVWKVTQKILGIQDDENPLAYTFITLEKQIKSLKNLNKIIFFDIGGTLGDGPDLFNYIAQKYNDSRTELIAKSISNIFEKLYSNKNEEEFLSVTQMLEIALSRVSVELKIEDSSKFAHKYYKEFYHNKSYLYDDVIETLKELTKKGVRLIVFSDADSDVMIEELKILGIYDFFEQFIISSDVKSYKPSNKIVNEALKYCDIAKSNIYIVGDSKVDILSGKKMNIQSVLINRSNEKIDYKSDYTISSLDELLSII